MPNWCSNDLFVEGSESAIKAFVEADIWNGHMISFQKIDPCPQELLATDAFVNRGNDVGKVNVENYGATDWYAWQVENWGTKWDIDGGSRVDSPTSVSLSFDSAWAPPCAGVQFLSGKFPELTFRLTYLEPGGCYAGRAEYKDCEGSTVDYEDPKSPEFLEIAELFDMEEYFEDEEDDVAPEDKDDDLTSLFV